MTLKYIDDGNVADKHIYVAFGRHQIWMKLGKKFYLQVLCYAAYI